MAEKKSSKSIKIIVSLLVSAALLAYVISTVSWHEVAIHMKQISWVALIPATLVWVVHFYIRAFRWRFLLPKTDRPKVQTLFDGIMLGSFGTFILPLRAGEFIRPLYITRHTNYSFSTAFVSVVIERFFDLSMVLASFAAVTYLVPGLPAWAHHGALALSTLAIGIFIFILVGTFLPDLTLSLVRKVISFFPAKIQSVSEKFLSDFLHGASVLKDWKNLLAIVGLTAMVWASCFVSFYVFLSVLSIQGSFMLGVTIAVIVALAVAAPSAPGFIGVFQVACIAAFSLFNLSEELATAYSILNHAHQFLIYVLYGCFVLFREGISLGDLKGRECR